MLLTIDIFFIILIFEIIKSIICPGVGIGRRTRFKIARPKGHAGSSPALGTIKMKEDINNLAYIIGVAIGDGNLSNPNGRAVRLRVTCDLKYPKIIERICNAIQKLLPKNKVTIVKRPDSCCDISCYSNKWEGYLGWKAKNGPKYKQNIFIPEWVKNNRKYSITCLRGLIETDGSIYKDRGYKMVNFVTIIPKLAKDVSEMVKKLGFTARVYKIKTLPTTRYNLRVSKNVGEFIKLIKLKKN